MIHLDIMDERVSSALKRSSGIAPEIERWNSEKKVFTLPARCRRRAGFEPAAKGVGHAQHVELGRTAVDPY